VHKYKFCPLLGLQVVGDITIAWSKDNTTNLYQETTGL